MEESTRNLLDESVELMFRSMEIETQLGVALAAVDDQVRTEIAYYLLDTMLEHPQLPRGRTVRLGKVEEYIAHLIGVAEWRVARDALEDAAADLNEFEHELLEALDDLDE